MKKIIDLFAGAGGFSAGFEMAGYKTVFALEKDEWAAQTYQENHKNTLVSTVDIRKFSDLEVKNLLKKYEKIEGIIGGPPCQGFSLSGSRDATDQRNSLFFEFFRFVQIIKPKFFVMENVPGILSMKNAQNEKIIDIIENLSRKNHYDFSYKILNSADFGVPQTRKRVIMIGILSDLGIKKSKFFPDESQYKSEHISIADAIMDLPQIEAGQGQEIQNYLVNPQNKYQTWARKNSNFIKNHIAMRHTKRIIERFSVIEQGNSIVNVSSQHMQRKRGNPSEISGKTYGQNNMRPFANKPSPTIAASFQGNFIHPFLNRNFTAREAARLQSFPDSYVFLGKRTTMSWEKNLSQYNQIGNAVPPLLAKAIAKNLKKIL